MHFVSGLQRFQHIHKMMRNGTVQWFSVVRFTDVNDIHDELRLADLPDNKSLTKAFVVDLSSEEAYRKVLKQVRWLVWSSNTPDIKMLPFPNIRSKARCSLSV